MKIKLLFICLLGLLFTNTTQALTDYNKDIVKKFNFKNLKKSTKKQYPTTKGTILVTPDNFLKVLPIGHAAIVVNKDYVYEATSKGVVRGLNNWLLTKKRMFGLRVTGLSNTTHSKAVDLISKQLKKKYNWNFFNTKTRNTFYCSHLIWATFYDHFKVNLDTKFFGLAGKNKNAAIHPLELVLAKSTKTIFYYENK